MSWLFKKKKKKLLATSLHQNDSECAKYKLLRNIDHFVSLFGSGDTAFGGGTAIYAQWNAQPLPIKDLTPFLFKKRLHSSSAVLILIPACTLK